MNITDIYETWKYTFLRFFSRVIFENELVSTIIVTLTDIFAVKKIETDITLNDDI
jgi:hypothetical protein